MYSSPFLAEFYDIYWHDFFASSSDAAVFAAQLSKLLPDAPPRPLVLDVATGTGRILQALMAAAPSACFVGLDIAPDMIARAKEMIKPPSGASELEWIVGSALEMDSLMKPFATHGGVDYLTIGFGSVAHFDQPGQIEAFLQQVAKLLRPGSGRAAMSLAKTLLDVKGDSVDLPGSTATAFMPSKAYPGVEYKEQLVESAIIEGVLVDKREVVVRRTSADGKEQEWREPAVTRLKVFTTPQFTSLIGDAGMKVIEKVDIEEEEIWVVGHA